jgi:PAS domain S-box-containing protein
VTENGHPRAGSTTVRAIERTLEDGLRLIAALRSTGAPVDLASVVEKLASILVPAVADWCIVDVVDGGALRRHGDGAVVRGPVPGSVAEISAFAPPRLDAPALARLLLGETLFAPELACPALAGEGALSGELLASIAARSLVAAPIVVNGRAVAIASCIATGERTLAGLELLLIEHLAQRAGALLEHAELEQRARRGEDRFRVALGNSRIVTFEAKPDGELTWIYNSQIESRVGSMIGRRVNELMSKESSDALDEVMREVTATGARRTFDVVLTLQGERRHLTQSFEVLRDGSGKTIGLTGVAVDVTEAKRSEERLVEAIAFRERMMGVLGHDLRNPLSAIQGIAGLLMLDAALPEPTRRGLVHIDRATRRMAEMIQMVLDFAQTRFQGSLPVTPHPTSLGELSLAAVEEIRAAYPGCSVELQRSGDLDGYWDEARLAQVISNLLANALIHGDRGAPVRFEVHGDGAAVVLRVTNRGDHISAERLERLFEPFAWGADESSPRRPQGLGLGLYIARQIVLAHGGSLGATSDAGEIAFTVRLARGRPV